MQNKNNLNTDIHCLKIESSDYPQALKNLYKPPTKLFYRGVLDVFKKPSVAFVGTRRCTSYGVSIVEQIIAGLASYDLNIVSGLALGIDTIAHKAALKSGLCTTAVLGSGVDRIFPVSNQNLANQILKNGLLVSEYYPGVSPRKYHFPERNRIISGLSDAVVVVEAPEKSGALITADFAIEQGKDLFTVPADIDRHSCSGNLKLLKKASAFPLSSAKDLIDHLAVQVKRKSEDMEKQQSLELKIQLSPTEKKIFKLLSTLRPISLNQISFHSKIAAQKLLPIITMMEINGLLKQTQNGYIKMTNL